MAKAKVYTVLGTIELSTGTVRRGDTIDTVALAAAGQDDACVANLLADEALVEGIVDTAEVVHVVSGDGAVAGDVRS